MEDEIADESIFDSPEDEDADKDEELSSITSLDAMRARAGV